jgi:flavin reductase (DIM6/NTAB) family NADH-FMN oxidoreductase RutF
MYYSGFYPMHLGLLSVADNVMPIAWWTPISKEPFRFLLAIDRRNHSLALLREHREAVLHFFPFAERERVVRAGYRSGRRGGKAARLGLTLRPAEKLATTRVVDGADAAFELTVACELAEPAGDHVPFLCDVVHVHRGRRPAHGAPLLFLGWRDFATLGERARFTP